MAVLAALLLAAGLAAAPTTGPAAPSGPAQGPAKASTPPPASPKPPADAGATVAPKPPAGAPVAPKPKPLDPLMTVREAEARLREALADGADQAALGALAAEYVDYEDLARRSLGKQWAQQPKADRAALVAALRALLEATYLSRLRPGGEARTEVRLVRRQGADAEVHVLVSGGERQVPIDLRLQRGADGRWRVWDATVAGLALLEGYQEQFPQLLALGGMKRLLAQLEQERQAQLRPR